ncbi:MAG: IS200/IS605 family accessory protein TnpB-related protein [Acidilobaceae archaeon]
MEFKVLRRTVVLECYASRIAREALRDIVEPLKNMVSEMVEYALKHSASQNTLHRVFYERYRREYPWISTRVIKGAYRDAVRRAKSFRERLKKGKAYTRKPEVRRVTIVYSDNQDWKLESGGLKIRTHRGWVELKYRNNRQLHRYMYGGWIPASELKLKTGGGRRVLAYITLVKVYTVFYDKRNVIAVDGNENNITIAVFKNGVLVEVIRIETGLGRIVIAYAVRRKRISKGKSTKTREIKKKLRKLREGDRKKDILYKVAKFIEELARENNAVVVIGDISGDDKGRMEKNKGRKLKHRIHQWSIATLIKLLEDRPVHVVRVSERGSSSVDPFTGRRIDGYSPLVIRTAVRGANGKFKVVKIVLRVAYVDGRVVERDVVGAINIGLKYLYSDGSPVALGSTGAHEVWVKLMNPHQGPTPLTEIQVFGNTIKYR